MRYLVCIAILSCCVSGLRTIILTLAYSDSADDYLLTDSHERAALDTFMSDYRQKVTPNRTGLISDAEDTFTPSCLSEIMHPLRIWDVWDET